MKRLTLISLMLILSFISFSQLSHPSGYFTMYPYGSSYDDGSYAKIFYDGNNKKIKFWNSDNGTSHTGINVGQIYSTGYVGLGTENPDSRLHVVHSSGEGNAPTISGNIATFQTNAGTGYYASINVIGGTTGRTSLYFGDKDSGAMGGMRYNNSDNSLTIRTNGADNRLFINSLGLIGIATTNPSGQFSLSRGATHSGKKTWSSLNQATIDYYADSQDGYNRYLDISAIGEVSGGNGGSNIRFFTNSGTSNVGQEQMLIDSDGNIGIGTSDPLSKLSVNGQIRATEVKVLADITVPDYVFESDYELRTLNETKKYIAENKHLPEIPSASEIGENGIDLGDMNMRLLKKIEELTLYQIQLMEEMEAMKKELQELKK